MGQTKYEIMDFEEMSKNGLIWKINKEVLHPLGLALARGEDENGKPVSFGCAIAPDGFWEYTKEAEERNQEKYNNFLNSLGKIKG